ncbi:hypothetical protein [Salmonirosea aquatica]|uniref:HNH endonuclease n=1 Tax=Salmonirosea aquatica TaxID=2654236 RepID=A0A7C9BJL0_9BACT|nr:hypothetical protein [Cytophagaceae bacterium SJW1-29]
MKRKTELIALMGGGCANCGYDRNLSALHFHHVDADLKQFKLDMRVLSNKRWNLILEEAKKCILLCSNCHAEEHNPELFIPSVQRILRGASAEESADV